jgi:hypothetical protein
VRKESNRMAVEKGVRWQASLERFDGIYKEMK